MSSVYSDRKYRQHREKKRANRSSTLQLDLAKRLRAAVESKGALQFPCTQFQGDIAGFAHTVLGVKVWHKQSELFDKVQRAERREDGKYRVGCRSSHKASKTFSFAVVALYRYCCYVDSLTVLGAPSNRSIQKLVWREIRMLFAKSGVCYDCKQKGVRKSPCPHSARIPGDCKEQARTGLRGLGFSEVFGVVAKDGENFAGYSSPTLCYLLDESSGIKDAHYNVMFSNMASSRNGFIFAVSNPTRRTGWFYQAFHKQAEEWLLVHISAYDCLGVDIPGLATQQFIDDALKDWGRESSNFKIRVLGDFDDEAVGGTFTTELIQAALDRWDDSAAQNPGILVIGCDPAGASGDSDGIGFSVRRALTIVHVGLEYGLELPQIVSHIESLTETYEHSSDEPVCICFDSSGLGYDLQILLRALAKKKPRYFVLGVRPSDKAVRKPQVYDRVRDELVDNFREFLRDGGVLPPGESEALIEEAQQFSFSESVQGKLKATKKDLIKKILGRSPDSFDAGTLCAWPTTIPARRRKPKAHTPTSLRERVSNRQDTDSLRARMQGAVRR